MAWWTQILPFFVVRWIAIRWLPIYRSEKGELGVSAYPDTVFFVEAKTQYVRRKGKS